MNPTDVDFIHVRVVEPNPAWPEQFEQEAKLLRLILGDNLINLFHIGSTAVLGLRAKPILDIMPVVRDINRLDLLTAEMADAGYEALGEFGIPGRRYFRKGGRDRTHQIHAFGCGSSTDILRHLAFRNYLRTFPDVRDAYGALKVDLAARYPNNIDAYCDGKDAFVKKTERDALHWFWREYD